MSYGDTDQVSFGTMGPVISSYTLRKENEERKIITIHTNTDNSLSGVNSQPETDVGESSEAALWLLADSRRSVVLLHQYWGIYSYSTTCFFPV